VGGVSKSTTLIPSYWLRHRLLWSPQIFVGQDKGFEVRTCAKLLALDLRPSRQEEPGLGHPG